MQPHHITDRVDDRVLHQVGTQARVPQQLVELRCCGSRPAGIGVLVYDFLKSYGGNRIHVFLMRHLWRIVGRMPYPTLDEYIWELFPASYFYRIRSNRKEIVAASLLSRRVTSCRFKHRFRSLKKRFVDFGLS